MSPALYSTRLMWGGRIGLAKHRGVWADLVAPPPILRHLKITELDWAPEVRVAQLRELAGPMRDMTHPEIRECLRFVEAVAFAARKAIDDHDNHPI
jgi:hypothetical protein